MKWSDIGSKWLSIVLFYYPAMYLSLISNSAMLKLYLLVLQSCNQSFSRLNSCNAKIKKLSSSSIYFLLNSYNNKTQRIHSLISQSKYNKSVRSTSKTVCNFEPCVIWKWLSVNLKLFSSSILHFLFHSYNDKAQRIHSLICQSKYNNPKLPSMLNSS